MPLSQHRQAWRAAKATHKAHLAVIKFDQDFGPDLDKLEKVANSVGKNMGQMMSIDTKTKALARKCSQTANTYLIKVNAVADPGAKAALRLALQNIKADCDNLAK